MVYIKIIPKVVCVYMWNVVLGSYNKIFFPPFTVTIHLEVVLNTGQFPTESDCPTQLQDFRQSWNTGSHEIQVAPLPSLWQSITPHDFQNVPPRQRNTLTAFESHSYQELRGIVTSLSSFPTVFPSSCFCSYIDLLAVLEYNYPCSSFRLFAVAILSAWNDLPPKTWLAPSPPLSLCSNVTFSVGTS